MQVTIFYMPTLEDSQRDESFRPPGSYTTFWEIPNKFKQQVFEFLESFKNQRKNGEEYGMGRTHIEELVRNRDVSEALKEIRNLPSLNAILQRLYDAGFEDGKQLQEDNQLKGGI